MRFLMFIVMYESSSTQPQAPRALTLKELNPSLLENIRGKKYKQTSNQNNKS
jgi:hypothetical protein